jgi:checkpoint serine/threonine-protein kinase
VTDFAVIESQKENIQPLARGRSAAALGTLFDRGADEVVQEGVERHQRAIEEAERREREGEDMAEGVADVLDVYCQ